MSIKLKVSPNAFNAFTVAYFGATFNFIDIWLHNFRHNYFERRVSYTDAMVEMFKTTPQNVGKPLTSREKNQN